MDNLKKDNVLRFSDICGIENITFICGLNFPDSATEFQKAMLTMAHLSAICRENVMHGIDVPPRIIDILDALSWIIGNPDNYTNQR